MDMKFLQDMVINKIQQILKFINRIIINFNSLSY